MKTVWGAKADGAWYLHKYTLGVDNDLQSFILFSSIASLVGNIGQINYSSANSFLDSLVQYRRSLGLTAISIQWPGISGIGLAASMQDDLHLNILQTATPKSVFLCIRNILYYGNAVNQPSVQAILNIHMLENISKLKTMQSFALELIINILK
jgi:hypothetical protein